MAAVICQIIGSVHRGSNKELDLPVDQLVQAVQTLIKCPSDAAAKATIIRVMDTSIWSHLGEKRQGLPIIVNQDHKGVAIALDQRYGLNGSFARVRVAGADDLSLLNSTNVIGIRFQVPA